MTARTLAFAGSLLFTLTAPLAQATEQWEVRGSGFGLLGVERRAWDVSLGGGFDAYITDGFGALLGLDAMLVTFPGKGDAPGDLAVAPEVSVWLGEDVPTFRWLFTARPVFGILDLDDHGVRFFQRLELGPGLGLMTEDGSLRARVSLLWAPATDPHDGALEPLAFGLRLTFGWSPPLRLPPEPTGPCPLPCTPGCPC